ncbi:MAG TPA: cupin domain-containing protein [Rhizomicrobium sp.]|nr:cupin domain-containing protein [Rhizomicrobium sp.]
MTEVDRLIAVLALMPHPEGGHYRQTWRDLSGGGERGHSTLIYFLLKAGEVSRWHRIDAGEVWHFYRGAPLALKIGRETRILGPTIEHGEEPQLIVPPREWQSARSLGAYTLVGCTVAPGFDFSTFEMAPEGFEP